MPRSKNTKAANTPPVLAPRGDLVGGTVTIIRQGACGAVETAVVFVDIPADEDLNAVEARFLQEMVTAIPELRNNQLARDRFLHQGKGICRPDGVFWARHIAAGRWIMSRVSEVRTGRA